MLTDDVIAQTIRDARLLPDAALEAAIAAAKGSGERLASHIIARKLVAEDELYRTLAARLGVPYVDLRATPVDRSALERIPPSLAVRRRAVAYAATTTELRVAMEDPDDLETAELLRRSTDLNVIPALASPSAVAEALRLYHADVESAVAELTQLSVTTEPRPDERGEQDLHRLATDIPVVRIVDTLLQHAISLHASDIHIEPAENGVAVRYRIDGILRPTMTLPTAVAPGIVARIKILANLKIDEHRLPQDGRFKVATAAERYAIRVAIMPVYDGEKIVLRLLREEGKALTLAGLGLRDRARSGEAMAPLAIAERNLRKPHGIIFVTGPTGSGKTTTLYAMMEGLNTPGVNIAAIEDPIEYRMPGVNQSQVNPRIGFTFATGLRALLRQDPNVIMVGEIRDAETADIAVNAALTGHLVLATLHTNDAATALTRLQEMGVATFLVASTINAILAQRLVRRLCPACRKQQPIDDELQAALAARGDGVIRALALAGTEAKGSPTAHDVQGLRVWKPKGCAECRNEGYRGRVGIYEILEVTPAVAERIHERTTHDAIHRQAVEEGMVTMFIDGLLKAIDGTTTVEEILRVTRE